MTGQGPAPYADEWASWFDRWQTAVLAGGMARSTAAKHLRLVRSLEVDVDVEPDQVRVEDVEAWVVARAKTAGTATQLRTAARSLYGWAREAGLVERVPVLTMKSPGLVPTDLAPAWRRAVESYAEHLEQRTLVDSTRAEYLRHVGWLARDMSTGPWQVTPKDLSRWFATHSWSDHLRRKVQLSVRHFYAWGIDRDHLQWAPVAGMQTTENARRGPERRSVGRGWQPAVEGHLDWLIGQKRSKGTVAMRRYHLQRLSEVSADPWAVSSTQLAAWLGNPDWGPATAKTVRSSLREFYRWGVRCGLTETSPAEDLPTIRVPRRLPRPTPDDVLREALHAADDRTRLLIMFGALAGLRIGETARVHTRDVSPTRTLVTGKGGHQREVAMHPVLWEAIEAEVATRRGGRRGTGHPPSARPAGWLFPTDERSGLDAHLTPAHAGKLVSGCLPSPWTAHTLRHRFASMAYAELRDLLAVQQLLGHVKPETTAIYAQVPDTAMRAAVLGARL